MRILLDTHVFIWFIMGDRRLTPSLRNVLDDPANEIQLSVISIWESIVKHRLGKLTLSEPPEVLFPRERDAHGFRSLELDEASVLRLPTLPLHHKDPFDRILVCQALTHSLTIATVDPDVRLYPAPTL
jgi:PIN domain nuclease of toxin-antitoxin system